MQSVDVQSRVRRVWENVCKKVDNAVVFLQSDSAHWAGACMMMLQAGAINIQAFSPLTGIGEGVKKAVFILQGVWSNDQEQDSGGVTKLILKDMVTAWNFEHVVVFTDCCADLHAAMESRYGRPVEPQQVFQEFENMLANCMSCRNPRVEVIYEPFTCSVMTPSLFLILPDFPLLPTEIDHCRILHQRDTPAVNYEMDITHVDEATQLKTKLYASYLNGFLDILNVNEDCYALGGTSKLIASELASLPWAKNRRKTAQSKVSLLLVDRTLDLASAVSHSTETLLDKIHQALPKFANSDVRIEMDTFFSLAKNTKSSEPKARSSSAGKTIYTILPGCLANPTDHEASELLHYISTARQKEGLMEVNRRIVEAASSSGLPLKLTGKPGKVTADQLRNVLNLFRGNMKAIRAHSGLLQLCKAVADTLQSQVLEVSDSMLGVEKGLLQSLGDEDSPSVLKQITATIEKDLEKPVTERRYSLNDILILLVFVYSLLDETDIADHHERNLKAVLAGAVMESKTKDWPAVFAAMCRGKKNEASVKRCNDKVFQILRGLTHARLGLKKYKSVYNKGGLTSVASLKPLLQQVTEDIFNPNKPELVDVAYKSTGFKDLLKSGFGLFKAMTKPRPSDNPVLIIFVLGGITSQEVRLVKETVSASKSPVQVIVGSTSLISPYEVPDELFLKGCECIKEYSDEEPEDEHDSDFEEPMDEQ